MRTARAYIIFALCFIVWSLSGCSPDHTGSQVGAGRIIPVLTVDPEVVSVANPDITTTLADVPSADDFILTVQSADGMYSGTWNPFSTYFPVEAILPGTYSVEAYYGSPLVEGFDTPYYYGSASCALEDGAEENLPIDCHLANTLVVVRYADSAKEYFPECSMWLHSSGGCYISYPKNETRYAYLKPGKIYLGMALTMPDGRECEFIITQINDAKAGTWFPITVSVDKTDTDSPVVTVSFDEEVQADDISITLSPEFVNSPMPVIKCEGFVSDAPINIIEGQRPANPLIMTVPAASLSNLLLTTIAPSLIGQGWASEIDILSGKDISALTALGLKIVKGEYITIDFTEVIPHLRDTDGLPDSFTLQAITVDGKSSSPVSLNVDLKGAEVSLLSISSPVVGIDEASVKVFCDSDPKTTLGLSIMDGKEWIQIPVTSIEQVENEENTYRVDFKVPFGTAPLTLRLLYNGVTRVETELKRISPEFAIEVDAFALKAVVRIVPKDESLKETITRLAKIYAGNELTIQINRDEENGEIIVSGLKEKTTYRFKATVMSNPATGDFTPEVQVVTESVADIPNGNFEEIVNKYTKYNKMLSGGRYSQNIVEIFNLQNYTDFYFTVPEGWANVNAKTFNLRSKNINTWYVIPSVRTVEADESYAGTSYAVRIDNVAFDNDGAPIRDYLQEGQPYVKYSRNIPEIKYKAVGKIFLGSYKWDNSTMTEVYNEGISFTSRPAALNGVYRFVPAVPGSTQQGYVRVEVLGKDDKVLAVGEGYLKPALSYTAFTVPLDYEFFGEKALRVKVLVATSPDVGSIEHETQALVTVSDPKTSTSVRSSLWVDELAFSY